MPLLVVEKDTITHLPDCTVVSQESLLCFFVRALKPYHSKLCIVMPIYHMKATLLRPPKLRVNTHLHKCVVCLCTASGE